MRECEKYVDSADERAVLSQIDRQVRAFLDPENTRSPTIPSVDIAEAALSKDSAFQTYARHVEQTDAILSEVLGMQPEQLARLKKQEIV